jgi:hypothetical protein
MKTDNNNAFQTDKEYGIAQDYETNACGFGYETKNRPMKLWDGKGWTTDKAKALRFNNNPRARILAGRLLGRIKIVVL